MFFMPARKLIICIIRRGKATSPSLTHYDSLKISLPAAVSHWPARFHKKFLLKSNKLPAASRNTVTCGLAQLTDEQGRTACIVCSWSRLQTGLQGTQVVLQYSRGQLCTRPLQADCMYYFPFFKVFTQLVVPIDFPPKLKHAP